MTCNYKEGAKVAVKAAKQWRDEIGVQNGYVIIYFGRFHSFFEDLPPIDFFDWKKSPKAVDQDGEVYIILCGRWVNIIESKRPKTDEREHIRDVARAELSYCYPEWGEKIAAWFDSAVLDLKSKNWQRLERMAQRQIMQLILEGKKSINQFLLGSNRAQTGR